MNKRLCEPLLSGFPGYESRRMFHSFIRPFIHLFMKLLFRKGSVPDSGNPLALTLPKGGRG